MVQLLRSALRALLEAIACACIETIRTVTISLNSYDQGIGLQLVHLVKLQEQDLPFALNLYMMPVFAIASLRACPEMSYTNLPTVLVVEDSPDDLLFIQRAAVRTNLQISLKSVTSGDEAVSYLLGEGSYANRELYPLPNVILTDTRMPRMSGLELVTWIRQQNDFKDLPIVVMSSSTDTDNANQFTALGISLYFVKPMSIRGFEEILTEVMLLLSQNQA